jgi:putative ABC transport system permease protein
MIKHAFKIIINQWRKNVWIVIELFIVLSVLWFTVDFISTLWLTSRTPPGFDIQDTYLVSLALTPDNAPNYVAYEKGSDEPGRNFMRLIDRLRMNSNVEAISIGIYHYPYCSGNMTNRFLRDSLLANAYILHVMPEYFDVFRVKSAYGDNNEQLKAAISEGYVICRTIEERLFPESSAKGQNIYTVHSQQGDTTGIYRINNVVTVMKRQEFVRPYGYMFFPYKESDLMKLDENALRQQLSICIRTRHSNNPREMAGQLMDELKVNFEAGNFSLANIMPISELREQMFWTYGVYDNLQYRIFFTAFFLVNVFLGILGTFWLRINKRREEIGIRMALGSSRRRLIRQMHTESIILVIIAVIPAVLVWINIVMADLLPVDRFDVTASRLALNTLITLGLTALVTALATWYPARKAASLPAAEALRYE